MPKVSLRSSRPVNVSVKRREKTGEIMSSHSNDNTPLILAIDTATRAGSVALARGASLLTQLAGDKEASHSIDLIVTVEAALKSVGVKLDEIDLFAAAAGPGSFTGLRIGLASVKSFAMSVGRKCVGISTLAAIAYQAGSSAHSVALLPAGRGEVFAQLFSVDADGVRPLDDPAHLKPALVLEKYHEIEKLIWAGEGAQLISQAISDQDLSESQPGNWTLAPSRDELASSVAALAYGEYRGGRVTSPEQLRAIYVRPSDAEINEQWQSQSAALLHP